MKKWFGSAVATAALVLSVTAGLAQQPGALPPGQGRDIVAVACTQCHAPDAFAHLRQGAEAWRHQVYDMILRGAQVGPGDIDAAVKYMTTNFGPGVPFPGPAAPTPSRSTWMSRR